MSASLQSPPPRLSSVQAIHNTENKLHRLNADYVAALLASDADWFERHLASDFRCILADGGMLDRTAFLDGVARPSAMRSFDVEDVSVQVEGEVAIVQARSVFEQADGRRGQARRTDVWIGRDGRWQALTAQTTPLATP
jgi:ketosteroid isomerase-like protein